MRRLEDVTQEVWGTRMSAATVSDLHPKINSKVDEWC